MDGINAEVQAEIDIVKKQGIRALYYFCDENSSEKTVLEQSIAGSNCAKSKTVHSFSGLGKDGADDFINDIVRGKSSRNMMMKMRNFSISISLMQKKINIRLYLKLS